MEEDEAACTSLGVAPRRWRAGDGEGSEDVQESLKEEDEAQ